jgi:HK97 family phage major capsid protein
MYAMPKASQKLLDDANLNVEAWLSEHISAKFGRDEATAFITGNGVNKPMGIMSYASGTSFGQVEQINSGSSGAFTADGLIDLVYGLKEPYKANAVFLMARSSVKLVRKLKDSQNQYLWAPGLNGNSQSQLLGFPIYEAADVAAASASSLSAAFGDFRAAYQIVDRVGIRMLRDPYSSKPHILFYTTRRVGGAVKNFEAFKIHKLAV